MFNMLNLFFKQPYAKFVLPLVIIPLLLLGVFIWDTGAAPASYIAALVVGGGVLLGIRFTSQLLILRHHLEAIEHGTLTDITPPGKGPFGALYTILNNIVRRIRTQEGELQREKIRRLRSVIDGLDQERNRLSRELHDGIGQSLIAIKLQLENAETQNYSMMRAGIDSAKNMIDLTIEDVRLVCNALLPAALNEFGIVSTLRSLCSELGALAGFEAVFENSGAMDRMSKKSQVYIYRIAQEALHNIAKHARATKVVMKLGRADNIVTLEVSDNGKGFIFDPVSFAQRNGLQNMRERTQLLQGEFIINSKPGYGTTIKVSIPYSINDGKDQTDIGG